MRKTYILVIAAAVLASASPALAAARKMSVWSGAYTEDQAAKGATLYQGGCAMCHGAALEGNGEAPPLVGRFIPDWQGTSLADIFDKIHDTMPLFAPGSLSAENTAAILAFVLKENGFPAGSRPVPVDGEALKMIRFDASKLARKSSRPH